MIEEKIIIFFFDVPDILLTNRIALEIIINFWNILLVEILPDRYI